MTWDVEGYSWRGRRAVALALLVLFGVPAFVAASPEPAARASFHYEGSSALEGEFLGECDAMGATRPDPAAPLELSAGRIVLVLVHTRVNYTSAADVYVPPPVPDTQWLEIHVLETPALRIEPRPRGLAVPYGFGEGRGRPEPFTVHLEASRLESLAVVSAIESPVGFYHRQDPTGIYLHRADFGGPGRLVAWEGSAVAAGDATVFLREADLRWADGEFLMPPYARTEQAQGAGAVHRETVHYTHGFLDLHDASFALPAASALACAGLRGSADGAYTAADASGEAGNATDTVTFNGQVLSLVGRFQLDEETEAPTLDETGPGRVRGRAEGQIQAFGVDFSRIQLTDASALPPAYVVGFWLLLGLAVLAVIQNLGSLVGIYYSRFGRGDALQNPNRDMLYQAVIHNPGADLTELRRVTSLHITTVVYHVQVLRRLGLVGTLRHGRSVRVLPSQLLNEASKSRVLSARDEKFAFLAESARTGPVPVRQVVKDLIARFGGTRRGAYLVVERAVARGVLVREGTRGGLVRCAP